MKKVYDNIVTKNDDKAYPFTGVGICELWYGSTNYATSTQSDRNPIGNSVNQIRYTRNRQPLANFCLHKSSTFVEYPYTGRLYFADVSFAEMKDWSLHDYRDEGGWICCSQPPDPPYTPDASSLDDFNARAWDAMFPDLESKLNLTVSLVEIADITRVFANISSWMTKLGKLGKLKSLKRSGLSTKDIAQSHLSYAFGVMPVLSDVKGIYDTIVNFDERIKDFIHRSTELQKRHYREMDVESGSDSTEWTSCGDDRVAFVKYERQWTTDLFATMEYTYTIPDLESVSNKVRALRDMMGLRLNLSTIWELIPFSFVVDWFFRVGDFIRQFEDPLIKAEVSVKSYCITSRRRYTVTQTCKFQSEYETWTEHVIYRSQGKMYKRTPCLPNSGVAFINSGQYGLNQLVLSASLLRSMRR